MIGFAAAIVVFAAGMGVGIHRMNEIARAHEMQLRDREHEGSLIDQVRARGDLVIQRVREYLLAPSPTRLAAWQDAEGELARILRTFLAEALPGDTMSLVSDVASSASEFARIQAKLTASAPAASDHEELAREFETEILPVWRALEVKLDRLAAHAGNAFRVTYEQAEADRRRSTTLMYASLGLLAVLALGIGWYFAQELSRSYRKEHSAHEAARRAVAARDELMGVVAHDLRSPLNAITIGAAILRERAESEPLRKQADSIERVAIRMDRLIKTMLDVATIEAGRFTVQPAPCRVEDVLREISDVFGKEADSKRVRLDWSVESPKLQVRADRDRLLQVLTNLVANALKFTPSDGRVSIAAELVDGDVRFAVADTGPGIAAEDLPRVFDRFWKKETGGQKGTGLGLFIAHSIIEAHGGRIWVDSTVGRGTTFYFTLAAATSQPAEVTYTKTVPVPGTA